MKTIVNGHQYSLDNVEGGHSPLQFIHKENINGILTTIANGTTNEEVLRVLIDRINYLQNSVPSIENVVVITKLEEALKWLENRTADQTQGEKLFNLISKI